MDEQKLRRRRILVVEDDYFIAAELRAELDAAGAIVLGPTGTLESAFDLAQREPRIDAALLDINLKGEMVFPLADLLVERGVPFLFATGYGAAAVAERFRHILRCEKPVAMAQIAGIVAGTIRPRPPGRPRTRPGRTPASS